MHNIGLIITREYLSRVRKKSFIIMTILGPLLMAGFVFVIGWTASRGIDSKSILILDESDRFEKVFDDSDEVSFSFSKQSLEESKIAMVAGHYDGLLYIPQLEIDNPEGVVLYSPNSPGITVIKMLENRIEKEIENIKLVASGIDQEVLKSLDADIDISTVNLSEGGAEKAGSTGAATAVGYIAGFMIYMFIFIYGAMCMRGVIEEKTSRIIEVVISSVKPFHLMLGKVIGIAGVGLTQFILWVFLTVGLTSLGVTVMTGSMMGPQKKQDVTELPQQSAAQDNPVSEALDALSAVDIPMVVFAFVFFFFSGYLLYGALFAAIGSAADVDVEVQQFMLPITIPLITSIAMLSIVIQDPDGSVAFWMSMIPFTSPIIMMMRVPFGVEIWELALSMALMVLGFVFTIWVASRIYRIGILMHGTKVSYKVLARWFMMKN